MKNRDLFLDSTLGILFLLVFTLASFFGIFFLSEPSEPILSKIICVMVFGFCCLVWGLAIEEHSSPSKYYSKDKIEEGKPFKIINARILDAQENPNELLLYICFDEKDYYLLKANKTHFNTEDPQPDQTYIRTTEAGVKKYTFSMIEVKD